jgi:hypothetical protein
MVKELIFNIIKSDFAAWDFTQASEANGFSCWNIDKPHDKYISPNAPNRIFWESIGSLNEIVEIQKNSSLTQGSIEVIIPKENELPSQLEYLKIRFENQTYIFCSITNHKVDKNQFEILEFFNSYFLHALGLISYPNLELIWSNTVFDKFFQLADTTKQPNSLKESDNFKLHISSSLTKAIETNEKHLQDLFHFETKTWYRLTIIPISNPNHQLIYVLISLENVSKEKTNELNYKVNIDTLVDFLDQLPGALVKYIYQENKPIDQNSLILSDGARRLF